MTTRLVQYLGFFRTFKDQVKESWTSWWENGNSSSTNSPPVFNQAETNFRELVRHKLDRFKQDTIHKIDSLSGSGPNDFAHIYRRKTRMEMVKISSAVCGIEFSYAAETAFVSPLLLNLGLRHRHLTLMWFLSPLLGFFITPLLGSCSDGCRSKLGRRRPFIILLSIGIVLGLLLVPNGKQIGIWFGDTYSTKTLANQSSFEINSTNTTSQVELSMPHGLHDTIETHFPMGFRLSSNASANFSDGNYTDLTNSAAKRLEYVTDFIAGPDELQATNVSNPYKTDQNSNTKSETLNHENSIHGSVALPSDPVKTPNTKKSHHKKKVADESIINYLIEDVFMVEWEEEFKHPSEHKAFIGDGNGKLEGATIEERGTDEVDDDNDDDGEWKHSWGLFFTVLGTVLLDFNADACQSPSRAYMLDVTVAEDQARGLSTFTIIAGLGGACGYFLGAINWENTFIGNLFGGQVRAVFTLILFIFIGCVITTITSFCEIPIDVLNSSKLIGSTDVVAGGSNARRVDNTRTRRRYSRFQDEDDSDEIDASPSREQQETSFNQDEFVKFEEFHPEIPTSIYSPTTNRIATISATIDDDTTKLPTFKDYIKTIVRLPSSLKWLCLTNFFSWLSLVCYSLYFTDFVGEAVFKGNPNSPLGTNSRTLYQDGVRFGCFGMSFYSISCSIYSFVIEKLVDRFGAKKVYIMGHIVYSIGMVLMACTCSKVGVILFSWTSGIMYSTLFTMPYLLVARYHASEIFDMDSVGLATSTFPKRGLGTDVAIVSSMVFLAQMTQSLILGTLVTVIGSTVAIIIAASIFAACGAVAATKVLYLDL